MSLPNNQQAPYVPTTWALGGPTEKHIDVPVQAVFLALFAAGAATHMTIFQVNRRRAHKFIPNAAIFGFCMSRIVTMVLRIASACLPHDIQLAIAASIFVSAGVLIIFVINLIFAQRLIRPTHPSVGWHPTFSIAFKILWILIGCTLAIVITSVVQSFYTLNHHTRRIDRDLQLYGSTCLAVIATLPIPLVIISLLVPHPPHDRFGKGHFRTKVAGLLVGATLLSFGAWYRCATVWHTPISRKEPLPGFLGKAPFYIVNFTVEIITVYLYAIIRVDKRFHIPNGAKGPGSYSKSTPVDTVETNITRPDSHGDDEAEATIEEINQSALGDYDVEKGQSTSYPLAERSTSRST